MCQSIILTRHRASRVKMKKKKLIDLVSLISTIIHRFLHLQRSKLQRVFRRVGEGRGGQERVTGNVFSGDTVRHERARIGACMIYNRTKGHCSRKRNRRGDRSRGALREIRGRWQYWPPRWHRWRVNTDGGAHTTYIV